MRMQSQITFGLLSSAAVVALLANASFAQDAEAVDLGVLLLDAEDASDNADFVAKRSATGLKTNAPIENVPQSVTALTRERLDAQNIDSINDALRYTPGVISEAFGNDTRVNFLRFRGFQETGSEIYRDGLALRNSGFGQFFPELYGAERVEVLRGPSSGLFGQANPGGLINIVTKRPTENAFAEFDVFGGSFETFGGRFDVGGKVTEDGRILARLTGLYRDGDTQVDFVDDSRFYIAPAITFKPNDRLSFTLLAQYQEDDTGSTNQFLPAQGTVLPNPNGSIGPDTFLGEPGFDDFKREVYSVGYILEYEFADNLKFSQRLRYTELDVTSDTVFGFGFNDPGLTTIGRGAFSADAQTQGLTIDTNLLWDFNLGGMENQLLVGLDYQNYELSEQQLFGAAFNGFPVNDINPFAPVFGTQVITRAGIPVSRNDRNELEQLGIYAQLQTRINERLTMTLNGRVDFFETELTDFAFGADARDTGEEFTGRVGFSYRVGGGFTPYVSYTTSFEPQLGIDAATLEPFEPTTGRQLEFGLRYQPENFNALFALSVFDIEQENVIVSDFTSPFLNTQIDSVTSQGIEFEADVSISPNWNINAAYSFTDIRNDRTGLRLGQVPEHELALYASYTFTDPRFRGLSIGGGARWRSNTVDGANTITVDGAVLFDAVVRYEKDNFNFSIEAENLFDKEYIASCSSVNACFFGSEQRITATFGYEF
ncbi:MAG: TonB-dependent siderophore receptor [Pseudomonadota bacterium]